MYHLQLPSRRNSRRGVRLRGLWRLAARGIVTGDPPAAGPKADYAKMRASLLEISGAETFVALDALDKRRATQDTPSF